MQLQSNFSDMLIFLGSKRSNLNALMVVVMKNLTIPDMFTVLERETGLQMFCVLIQQLTLFTHLLSVSHLIIIVQEQKEVLRM